PADGRLARTVAVEHLAHVDSATDELGARRHDVRHDEIDRLWRARPRRRGCLAEVNRTWRARRRELHHPELFTDGEVGVEPPTQAAVEALGAIDVGHGDDYGLELEIDRSGGAHGYLLASGPSELR